MLKFKVGTIWYNILETPIYNLAKIVKSSHISSTTNYYLYEMVIEYDLDFLFQVNFIWSGVASNGRFGILKQEVR